MEHKEFLENAPPEDVDVVTFFNLPAGVDQQTFVPTIHDLFDKRLTKAQYRVDAYLCVLGQVMGASDVKTIAYWYSMWSHRRNGIWKGFVQVDIFEDEDRIANELLAQIEQERASR